MPSDSLSYFQEALLYGSKPTIKEKYEIRDKILFNEFSY
jgi:hypothetical protein